MVESEDRPPLAAHLPRFLPVTPGFIVLAVALLPQYDVPIYDRGANGPIFLVYYPCFILLEFLLLVT